MRKNKLQGEEPKDFFGQRTQLQKNYNYCLGGIPFGYLVGQKY